MKSPVPSWTLGPLPATLPAAATAALRWEVVVVGAGPAGAAAALYAARAGLRTLLVERESMPRAKVCGCCLSSLAMTELAWLTDRCTHLRPKCAGASDVRRHRSMPPVLRRHPMDDIGFLQQQNAVTVEASSVIGMSPLHTVELLADGRGLTVPVPIGAVLSRESLDPQLIRLAIAAGSAWLPEMRVVRSRAMETHVLVTAEDQDGQRISWETDRLVIAAGLAESLRLEARDAASRPRRRQQPPRNRIGLGTTLPAAAGTLPLGRLVMAIGHHGYCGLVRLEDGRIDVAAAVDSGAVADAGPAGTLRSILKLASGSPSQPIDAAALEFAMVRATPPLTHRTPLIDPVSDRVMRVGDAAGYVEPFTGEGIGWALLSARLLATAICGAGGRLNPPGDAAAIYRRLHRRAFAGRWRRCRGVASLLRSRRLVAAAMKAATIVPSLAAKAVPLATGSRSMRTP